MNSSEKGGEARGWARQLTTLGHVGMMFPVSIGLGLLLGYWADGALGTRPWLALLGFGFGVAAGLRNLVRAAARFEEQEDRAAHLLEAEQEAARASAPALRPGHERGGTVSADDEHQESRKP